MIKLIMSDDETAMSLDVIAYKEAKQNYLVVFPESSLHPSKQMDVMEGIYKAYTKGTLGETYFIATHSELIILRAMRMIKEGRATINDIELWQSRVREDGSTYITQIRLNKKGDLLDHVKDGFFENAFREKFA